MREDLVKLLFKEGVIVGRTECLPSKLVQKHMT